MRSRTTSSDASRATSLNIALKAL